MSLVMNILKEMYNAELNYKGVKVNAFGIPLFLIPNKKSHKDTLYRLRREGYLTNDTDGWRITEKGRKKYKEKADPLQSFDSPFSNQSKRNLLLSFDIPEPRKTEREWLRMHLKKFNYKMIQRSLWFGPSPLPKDFVDYLKNIKLEKCIKTFKLSKSQKNKN
ncbi:MAG: hypothetical protein WCJ74_01690 [bacterium]